MDMHSCYAKIAVLKHEKLFNELPTIKEDPDRYINTIEDMKETFTQDLTSIQNIIKEQKKYEDIEEYLLDIQTLFNFLRMVLVKAWEK